MGEVIFYVAGVVIMYAIAIVASTREHKRELRRLDKLYGKRSD